ncbi:MAG TPA: hypothetical protein VJ739_12185 [Gemmataceae bacterium]|nr:hypothetical protein [Gemmataceae bacterium]
MVRALSVPLLALALVPPAVAAGAPKADTATPPVPKAAEHIPTGWKKLGLAEEQRDQLLTIGAKYRFQLADLERQVKELRQKERAEPLAVLTDAQRQRLVELTTEKATGAPAGASARCAVWPAGS